MSFKIVRPYQLAARLGVHRATIHRMTKDGRLPAPKKFSKRLHGWTEKEISEWLESRDRVGEESAQ